jgi:ATP-binding cassette subfamily B protein
MTISFRQVARFAWSYFARRPILLGLLVVLIAIKATLEVALPYLVGELIDHISTASAFSAASFVGALPILWVIFGTGVAFHALTFLGHFIYDWYLKFPALRDAMCTAFARVQRFSTDWHNNSFAGAVVTKIKRGESSLERFADQFYGNFIQLGFVLLGMIILIWLRWAELGAVFAVGILVYTAVSIWAALRFVLPVAREAAKNDTHVGAALADTVSCNASVKMFGRERAEDRRFMRVAQRWMLVLRRRYWVANLVGLGQNMVMTIIKNVLFFSAVWFWARGTASVGDVVFVIANYNLLQGHLRQIGQQIRETQQAANDMEEMVEYCQTEPQVLDVPGVAELKVKKGTIEFDRVTFTYANQKQPTYKNFSLTIEPGQRVALVGHSGGGKTTFVKLLQRLYDLDSGTITIDDQDISQVTQESLRRVVSLVPQDPILFHRSLAENIAYARPEASPSAIEKAARQAHAHEFISRLPQKYETLVGERGVKLSGGERQRVALARAILADAPILILDEATSSLDSLSEKYIQEALEFLMRGRTTIVVAHRLSTIKKADRILVFEGGKIIEDGSHAQLIRKKGLYHRLYELQAGGFIGE